MPVSNEDLSKQLALLEQHASAQIDLGAREHRRYEQDIAYLHKEVAQIKLDLACLPDLESTVKHLNMNYHKLDRQMFRIWVAGAMVAAFIGFIVSVFGSWIKSLLA